MTATAPRATLAGPGFALVRGAAAQASLACAPSALAGPALEDLVLAAEESLGADAQLAVVLTLEPLACGSLYYLPLANDVRGIGYVHHDPREVFDDTPEHRLEGIAFLNDWPYWQAHPAELEGAFNHELGHRFGARVRALVDGQSSTALLGRDLEHWSYFFSTSGSPLEGNVWVRRGPGYVSDTPLYPARFSPLDLYLMGAVPPAMVPAERLLLETRATGADCAGESISPSSPPQTCAPLELPAASTLVSIEDVIAVEGPRDPAATSTPRSMDVLILMVESGDAELGIPECDAMQAALRARLAGFSAATSGLVLLRNVLSEDVSCAELGAAATTLRGEARPGSSVSGAPGCAVSAPTPGHRLGPWVWIICLLGGAMRREIRRVRTSRDAATVRSR